MTFEPGLNYHRSTQSAPMKKLFFSFVLSIFLIFNSFSYTFAAGYVNPVINKAGNYYSPLAGEAGTLTNNSTSVTLMFNNDDSSNLQPIVPGDCYILGQGGGNSKEGRPFWESVITDAGKDDEKPWWNLQDRHQSGWKDNDYALQAGGDTCGFVQGEIPGSGPDTAANFVRANADDEVWFYNLCTNFEGVRTDCNEKFALNKTYKHTLFHVTCAYHEDESVLKQDKNSDGDMKDVIEHIDPHCNPNLADFNKQGQRVLSICCAFKLNAALEQENKDNNKAPYKKDKYYYDGSGSDTKIFQLAYQKVVDADMPFEGSFSVTPNLRASNFNPESNTVKTELGDLPRDPAELATAAIRIAIGIGGGVAFLLMVFGSFRLIFAGGNPESVQNGREIITSAIIGLLVIIFATFILQLVGISILGLKL